jgi:elongation factor G
MTQGQGFFDQSFLDYEFMNEQLQERVIAQKNKE